MDSPVRHGPIKELLHRWIPNPPPLVSRDIDTFADRTTKLPPMRPFSWKRGDPLLLIGGCWIFRGSPAHEYPLFRVPSTASWETAFTWIYDLLHGPAPAVESGEIAVVDHRCENKRCVNPDHLERVTVAVNVQRAKDRR